MGGHKGGPVSTVWTVWAVWTKTGLGAAGSGLNRQSRFSDLAFCAPAARWAPFRGPRGPFFVHDLWASVSANPAILPPSMASRVMLFSKWEIVRPMCVGKRIRKLSDLLWGMAPVPCWSLVLCTEVIIASIEDSRSGLFPSLRLA